MRYLACLFLALTLTGCSKLFAEPSFGLSYDPETNATEVVTPAPLEQSETPQPTTEEHKAKLSKMYTALDKFLQGKAVLLLIFILLQWIHLMYYTATGKTSSTLSRICTTIWNKMSFATKLVYEYIKKRHYKKHTNYPRLPK